jgi:hypothetical protein
LTSNKKKEVNESSLTFFWYKPLKIALKQLSFFYVGSSLWDLPWIVGYILSILFSETEATAMMFIDSEISSSSIEVMPNGIGSELEVRSHSTEKRRGGPQFLEWIKKILSNQPYHSILMRNNKQKDLIQHQRQGNFPSRVY